MTESQREPVPRNDDDELAVARAFLDFSRGCAVKKTEGLPDEDLRRVLVPSGTTLLGLIRHLTVGERYWFGYQFAGEGEDRDWEPEFDAPVPTGMPVDEVVDAYRAAILASNAIIEAAGDPGVSSRRLVDGQAKSLRWVLAHMTSETTRHAGHADILREQVDGVTGR